MIEEYLKQNPGPRARRSASSTCGRSAASAWIARPQERRGQRHAGRRRGRVHARARRAGLPRPDAGQGRPDEAVHDRQAEDQRQRDGVAEAAVPVSKIDPTQGDRGRSRSGAVPAAARQRPRLPAAAPAAASAEAQGAEVLRGARRSGSPRTRASRRRSARRSTFNVTDPDADADVRRSAARIRASRRDAARSPTPTSPRSRAARRCKSLYQHGKLGSTAMSPSRIASASSRASSKRRRMTHAPQSKCHRRRNGSVPEAGQERGVSRDGDEGRQGRARRREGPVHRGAAGVRRLRLRRLDVRPARDLPARPHRHPGVQRQQQLLDRQLRADARRAGGRRRHGRVRDRRRLRADGSRRAAGEVDRSREPARQVRQRDERGAGLQPGAARRADVRRRRPRVPLEVRHEEGDVRARSPRRRASTRRRTRTRCSRRRYSRRGDHAVARGVRSADPLPVLPADVRRGRGGAVLATSSRRSTTSRTRSTSRAR